MTYTLSSLFPIPPNIHRHHVVAIVSATTLKSLTCEVNNNDHLNTVQLPAGKMWVLALTWTLLGHTLYCRPSNPLPSLPAILPHQDNVSCQTTIIPPKYHLGMAQETWKRAQSFNLASKLPWSPSNELMGCNSTQDPHWQIHCKCPVPGNTGRFRVVLVIRETNKI